MMRPASGVALASLDVKGVTGRQRRQLCGGLERRAVMGGEHLAAADLAS